MKRWGVVVVVSFLAGCPAPVEPMLDAPEPVDASAPDARSDGGRDAPPFDAPADCTDPDRDDDGTDSIACGGLDCDDDDADRAPSRTEICDPGDVDEDCDPTTFGTNDLDGDTHVDAACCNEGPSGAPICGDDCDDTRTDVYGGLIETCDGRNNDCDLSVDEGVLLHFYPDVDGDGFGDASAAGVEACAAPTTFVANDTDCDDTSAMRNPGLAEVCDGIDNDCDDMLDGPGEDDDGDGFADDNCAGTGGRDCDDTLATIHDGATEICDAIDQDCSVAGHQRLPGGAVVNAAEPNEDADGDMHAPADASCIGGFPLDDCAPTVATRYPGATELCNGADDDCDGTNDDGASATCTLAGATSVCTAGSCAIAMCTGTAANCNTTAGDGCEIDTATSAAHCGSCGMACPTGATCRTSACRPSFDYARVGGGVGSEFPDAVAMGGGLVCMVGTNGAPASFGGATVPAGSFVACFDQTTGSHMWSRQVTPVSSFTTLTVAVDAMRYVYVGGEIRAAWDFGGGVRTVPGASDGFVAAYRDGAYEWDRRFGGSGSDAVLAIALGPDGELYAAGSFDSTDFSAAGAPAVSRSGGTDAFLTRLTAAGARTWSRTVGNNYNDRATGVAADTTGVYLTGTFGGTVDFGGATLVTGLDASDNFLAGYARADAAYRWSRRIGGSASASDSQVAAGGGTVGLVAPFRETVTIGGSAPAVSFTAVGTPDDGVAVAYTSAGVYRWAHQVGGSEYDTLAGVTTDASGGLVATGYYEDTMAIGSVVHNAVGASDLLVVSWDASGTLLWSRSFGGPGYDGGAGITGTSSFFIAGDWASTIDFGDGTHTSSGGSDQFLLHLVP